MRLIIQIASVIWSFISTAYVFLISIVDCYRPHHCFIGLHDSFSLYFETHLASDLVASAVVLWRYSWAGPVGDLLVASRVGDYRQGAGHTLYHGS